MISYKSLLTLLFSAALILSCSKEEKSVEPNNQPQSNTLLGLWNWHHSYHAMSGDSSFSGDNNITKQLDFYTTDSVVQKVYENGNLLPKYSDTSYYKTGITVHAMDTIPTLFIDDFGYYMDLQNDSLYLDRTYVDGLRDLYLRN